MRVKSFIRSALVLGGIAISVFVGPVLAADLRAPTGPVILTISGDIGVTNVGETAQFDFEMLRELPATEFATSTIWTEGVQTFTGVPLGELVAFMKTNASVIDATALNDYSVKVPVSDGVSGGPIIAYLIDGKPFSRRDKGPLWIVYPYDIKPEYKSELTYTRSIWQLDRLHFSN